MKPNPIDVDQAVDFAWSTFKRRYDLFIAILLIISGAWVALEVVVIAGQQFGILLWGAAHLAFLIFFAGIQMGLFKICLALYNGQEPTFADVFSHLALGPKFLVGQILYLLMVVVGLALLVVPGVYLGVRYSLFGFCLATGETSLLRSWQQSAIQTTGTHTWLLMIFASLLVLNLLGASLLGLGLFVTMPLSVLMMTAVYQQLNARLYQSASPMKDNNAWTPKA